MNETPLSKAMILALQAVQRGLVTNVFDRRGNVFRGPPGTSPRCYRQLQKMRLIEDVPGQRSGGAYASHFVQQLTKLGRDALAKATGAQP